MAHGIISRFIPLTIAFVFVLISHGYALDEAQWKEGERVETRSPFTTLWEPAIVIKVEDWRSIGKGFLYRVRIDDKKAANPEWATTSDLIRLPQTSTPSGDPKSQKAAAASAAQTGKVFKVGDLVDVYYKPGQGKNRGNIIEIGDGRYKVHYTGMTVAFDEWVDHLAVREPATISSDAAEIKFLIGKWSMFTPSYANTVVKGENVYREYGPGAKSPPLEINADGSYRWHFDFSHPPVKGRWITDAKVPGADMGTQCEDGILINDASGQEWKVYRRVVKGDSEDHITVHRMGSGMTDIGTRIR